LLWKYDKGNGGDRELSGIGTTVADVDGGKQGRKEVLGFIVLGIPIAIATGYIFNSFLVLNIAIGSVGGIVHDLIQNKGLVVFPASTKEGIYLGLALGALFGAVSGFIAYTTIATPSPIDAKSLVIPLTWGLGLKGLVDGAGNKVTTSLKAKP
jgi:hypothetical protein